MHQAILDELAEYAVGLSFEEIPKSVIHQANRCLLDLLGCYWGGWRDEKNRELLTLARRMNPNPQATIWGIGDKAGMAEVAFAHGCIAHHFEYDDGISLGAHWGSESIPAALAMAELTGRGSHDLLAAIVVSYEVGNRVSQVFSAQLLSRGVHFPCMMGIFGAATGVARLAGLSASQMAGALGNACLTPVAAYRPALTGDPIKDAYAGWPNALGILVTLLSQAGWAGPSDLLEGEKGLGEILGLMNSRKGLQKRILRGLGSTYEIMKTYFKPYPCCRWFHAAVQAILDLKQEGQWSGEEITSFRIEGPAFLKSYWKKDGFEKEITARFSLPYVAAAAALYGRLGLEEFDSPRRQDPVIKKMIQRVKFAVDPALDKVVSHRLQTRVRIKLKNGKRWERECGLPWGPDDPPTDKEMAEKFSYLAKGALHPRQIEEWLALFSRGIEHDGRLESLFQFLSTRI